MTGTNLYDVATHTTVQAYVYQNEIYLTWSSYGYKTYFSKSSDHGSTFSNPIQIGTAYRPIMLFSNDIIYLVSNQVILPCSIYASHCNVKISIIKSLDGGSTFSDPVNVVTYSTTTGYSTPAYLADVSDYTLIVTFYKTTYTDPILPKEIVVFDIFTVKSTDGGNSFGQPIQITEYENVHNAKIYPTILDLSIIDGRIYLVWNKSEERCNQWDSSKCYDWEPKENSYHYAKGKIGGSSYTSPLDFPIIYDTSRITFLESFSDALYVIWQEVTAQINPSKIQIFFSKALIPPDAPPEIQSNEVILNEDTSATITLHGDDADEDALTFTIVSNPLHGSLNAVSAGSDSATFKYTPSLNYYGSDSFVYKVNDGTSDSNNAIVTLTVVSTNDKPIAEAGPDQTVNEQTVVTLESGGADADGDTISYSWTQTSGTPVILDDIHSSTPTFMAPDVSITSILEFELIVNDGTEDSKPDTVDITVQPVFSFSIVQQGVATLSKAKGGFAAGDYEVSILISGTYQIVNNKPQINLESLTGTVSLAEHSHALDFKAFKVVGNKRSITYNADIVEMTGSVEGKLTFASFIDFQNGINQEAQNLKNTLKATMAGVKFDTKKTSTGLIDFI